MCVEIKRNDYCNIQMVRTLFLEEGGAGVEGVQVVSYSLKFSFFFFFKAPHDLFFSCVASK